MDAQGQPDDRSEGDVPRRRDSRAEALLPLALHKGYGLLFAAELLAGVLGSGGTSNPSTAHLDTIRNNMLTVVIDPASLVESDWMEPRVRHHRRLRHVVTAGEPGRTGPGRGRP